MVRHYILMSSSYSEGKRIALHMEQSEQMTTSGIQAILQRVRNDCGQDVPVSLHYVEAANSGWQAVVASDQFFKGVECIPDVETFIQKIKRDRVLRGIDVAKYIASQIECTHLKLQKLVYFCYADYLCKYSERLFRDTIYAFRNGPVVDTVYETLKGAGYDLIKMSEEWDGPTKIVDKMPARSRILFAESGAKKLQSIDQTIAKYGNMTAGQLRNLTHQPNTPWSHVDSDLSYQCISDDLIKRYHHNEIV
nr:MAG TPA: hypothetical protein [Caudoviricetes sp.]